MVKHDFPTPPPPTTTSLYSRRNYNDEQKLLAYFSALWNSIDFSNPVSFRSCSFFDKFLVVTEIRWGFQLIQGWLVKGGRRSSGGGQRQGYITLLVEAIEVCVKKQPWAIYTNKGVRDNPAVARMRWLKRDRFGFGGLEESCRSAAKEESGRSKFVRNKLSGKLRTVTK